MREQRKHGTNAMEYGKIPPNAVELEDAVLGAMLLEKSCISTIAEMLTPESFYKLEHQQVFEAILDLYAKDSPVDIITVTSWLKSNGKLKDVGGAYAVSKLTDRVASAVNAEYHARIIQQKHIQRELIKVTSEIYNDSFDETADPLDLIDMVSKRVERVASMLSSSTSGEPSDHVREVVARAEKAAQTKGLTGLSTGFTELDKLHGGRHAGQLVIIAGRPAMGKSAVALCEAMKMAEDGKQVLFVSLEMGAVELMQRVMSVDTRIFLDRFRTGDMDEVQWAKLNASAAKWAKLGLRIIDDVHTLSGIRAEARRMKEKRGLDAIYIDYIQLVSHSLSGRNRENEVSEISRSFKLLSRSMNCPVIALSQLSRSVETRGGNKKPMLSDLRESGAIEQDADVVEFIYRPEYYGLELDESTGYTSKGLALRLVAKNRHGGLAEMPMRFDGPLTRFTDWEESKGLLTTSLENRPVSAMRPNTNFYEKDDDQPF